MTEETSYELLQWLLARPIVIEWKTIVSGPSCIGCKHYLLFHCTDKNPGIDLEGGKISIILHAKTVRCHMGISGPITMESKEINMQPTSESSTDRWSKAILWAREAYAHATLPRFNPIHTQVRLPCIEAGLHWARRKNTIITDLTDFIVHRTNW